MNRSSTSGLALDSFETLHNCIGHFAQQTQKTVVAVCDQFEQFFTMRPQRSARQPLIKAISACVNDLRIPGKFLFILREDHLGRMVEFESDVPEAIEQRKRFYLPLFNAADAVRVLRQQADKAGLDWPENFVRAVVSDLTHEERVRPIELQLVGAALAVSGISNEPDFAREGRAQGLMVEYLRLTLNSLGESQGSVRAMKQILLALVAEPAARLALTPEKIARRAIEDLTIKVIRRGLPWLGLLGNDVLVDTGYTAIRDVERYKREELQGLIHWQWDNRLGGVVEREAFVNHLNSAASAGLLLCQTGQINAGIERLAEALKSNNSEMKDAAQNALNMRDTDQRVHLRIAAWNVFVEAAELRANRRNEEN